MQTNDTKILERNFQKDGTNNKTATNSGFAKFGLEVLMGRSFYIFVLSPNGMV